MSQGDRDITVADGKRTTTSTAVSSPSNYTVDTDVKAANDLSSDPLITKSSWKDLFAFTKLSHSGPLLAALMSSAIAACFKVALAVVLGQVFDLIGEFGSGTRSGHSTMIHVARWTLIIFGLGIGNWIAHSAFLALWIMFGELQASSVREDTFHSLLSKDMSWFDSQDQGVSSLLVRIQT
jgi:ATP-binding cassette subfamily B (MDR/TAP) protein 1